MNASSPRLTSFREGYIGALVHTAILAAADDSEGRSRNVRQTAISIAAHNVLVRNFQAQYRTIDAYVREIEDLIGASSQERSTGKDIGTKAAVKVVASRVDDKVDEVSSEHVMTLTNR